ncbi:30605_t:CDS:2, partial [Racocetra persica]
TTGRVREIIFNDISHSATIFLSDGTNNNENLDIPKVVLISEETYQKIINDLANLNEKKSIIIEDNDENDTLNFEDDQWTEDSYINDHFKILKREEKNQ